MTHLYNQENLVYLNSSIYKYFLFNKFDKLSVKEKLKINWFRIIKFQRINT